MAPIDLQAAKQQMLRRQLRRRGIHDPRVLAAMAKLPREQFIRPELRDEAYADCALGIDCGQTISQPYIVALMTQALELSGGEKVWKSAPAAVIRRPSWRSWSGRSSLSSVTPSFPPAPLRYSGSWATGMSPWSSATARWDGRRRPPTTESSSPQPRRISRRRFWSN